MKRIFKTLQGKVITNVVDYIKDYLKNHKDAEILIGCDSQRHGKKTTYAVVIALYTPSKGGHVIYSKEKTPAEFDITTKLIKEVWISVEVAEHLKNNGLPKTKFIDIDLNPDPKYGSNKVLRQAIGIVEGMGYKVRWKKNGALVNCTADHIVRS